MNPTNRCHYLERYELIGIVIMALILLGLPSMYYLHEEGHWIIGQKNFYILRHAQEISSKNILNIFAYDTGVYTERPYIFHTYTLVLAGVIRLFNTQESIVGVQLLIGILSLVIFRKILVWFNIQNPVRIVCMIMWILMPTVVVAYIDAPFHAWMIFIALGGVYSFLEDKKIPVIVLSLIVGNDWIVSVGYLLVLWMVTLRNKHKTRLSIIATLITVVSAIIILKFFSITEIGTTAEPLFTRGVFELGGIFGFGVFHWFLIATGIVVLWEKHIWPRSVWIAYIALLMLTLWKTEYLLLVSIPSSYIMSHGIMHFWKRTWHLKTIKNLTLFAMGMGIVYSYISVLPRLESISMPAPLVEALEHLQSISQSHHTIVTHPRYGFWIEYYGRKVMIDEVAYPGGAEAYNDLMTLLHSRDPLLTKKLLKKYNIQFIFITKEMKENLVWNKPNQGLLFLLSNTNNFKKKYSNSAAEIWELA